MRQRIPHPWHKAVENTMWLPFKSVESDTTLHLTRAEAVADKFDSIEVVTARHLFLKLCHYKIDLIFAASR